MFVSARFLGALFLVARIIFVTDDSGALSLLSSTSGLARILWFLACWCASS